MVRGVVHKGFAEGVRLTTDVLAQLVLDDLLLGEYADRIPPRFRSELFQAVAAGHVTPGAATGEFAANAFTFGMVGQGRAAINYSYGLTDDQQFTEGIGVPAVFQLVGAGTVKLIRVAEGIPPGESWTVTLRNIGPRASAWAERNGLIHTATLEPGTGGGMGAPQVALQLKSSAQGRILAPGTHAFNPDLPGGGIVSFEVGGGGLLLPAGRAHGPVPTGSFLSGRPIPNQAYVRGPLATLPEWNAATHVSDAFVPAGVRLQLSVANPNPSLPASGYGVQFQVLNSADKARVIYFNTRPLSP